MARQSLEGSHIDGVIRLARETLAAITEEYEEGEQQLLRLRSSLETAESQQAQRHADYERIEVALRALEEPSTAGNSQDIPDVTPPSTPHLVPLPTDEWVIEEVEGEPEQPHAEEHEPPPPEAA